MVCGACRSTNQHEHEGEETKNGGSDLTTPNAKERKTFGAVRPEIWSITFQPFGLRNDSHSAWMSVGLEWMPETQERLAATSFGEEAGLKLHANHVTADRCRTRPSIPEIETRLHASVHAIPDPCMSCWRNSSRSLGNKKGQRCSHIFGAFVTAQRLIDLERCSLVD